MHLIAWLVRHCGKKTTVNISVIWIYVVNVLPINVNFFFGSWNVKQNVTIMLLAMDSMSVF